MDLFYRKFQNLSDERLFERIERKDSFQKKAVEAAFKILLERGYNIEYPFPKDIKPKSTKVPKATIKKRKKREYHFYFKKHYSKIHLVRIIIFFLIFFPIVYLSNFFFTDFLPFRKLYIYSDLVISIGSLSNLLMLSLFFLIFLLNKKSRSELFRINNSKVYVAIKIFLVSFFILALCEIAFTSQSVLYQSYLDNTFRSFISSLWYDILLAFNEELIFKWLLLTQVLLRLGNSKLDRIAAYLLVSVLFAVIHIPHQLENHDAISFYHLTATFLYSYFTCVLYVHHRNFLLVVMLHFLADIPIVFTDNHNNVFFNLSLILTGIYTIPRLGRSALFKPTKHKVPNPSIAFFSLLLSITLVSPFINKSSFDHFKLSDELHFIGQSQEALKEVNLAIEKDKRNKRYFNHRGRIFYDLEQYQNALNDFNSAIKIDSQYYDAIQNRGYANLKLEKNKDCIDDFSTAIIHGFNSSNSYHHRAKCFYEIMDNEKAKADFEIALKLDSTEINSYLGLAKTQLRLEQFGEALETLYQAILLDSTSVAAYELVAITCSAIEEYETSNSFMTMAIEMGSQSPLRFYVRGVNYYHLDDYFNAEKEFKKSEEFLSNKSELYLYLAYCYENLGENKKSCEYIKKAAIMGNVEAISNEGRYCN